MLITGVGCIEPCLFSLYKLTFPLTTGVLKILAALDSPFIDSTNCHMISEFSGLPKFKQLVIAKGSPPDAIIFLQDSATAIDVPIFGSKLQYDELQLVVKQTPFLVPLILITAESEPGTVIVLVPTI